jgi:hypothetical protein
MPPNEKGGPLWQAAGRVFVTVVVSMVRGGEARGTYVSLPQPQVNKKSARTARNLGLGVCDGPHT